MLQAIASIATAGAVLLAWWQFRQGAIAARTDFEDELDREYRDLARQIPTAALLGKELTELEQEDSLKDFFHYIDLCNQQVFLRANGRIGKKTWHYWRDGIRFNLSRPAFRKAWDKIKPETESFSELRRLEESDFGEDPHSWTRARRRLASEV